jgi:hypothetical protein
VTRSREQLIRGLVDDLAPRQRLASRRVAVLAWLALSVTLVAMATLVTGPLRPGALAQLVSDPGFTFDLLLGAVVAVLAVVGLMRLRIPGAASGRRVGLPVLALLVGWGGFQLLESLAPPVAASALGARSLCWLQVLLFALPPLAVALAIARRAAPLERAWTGLAAGLAAGALSALAMQIGCMDEPLHALVAHLGPVLLVAAVGAGLGRLVLRRI